MWDVCVASEVGLLKGVNISKKSFQNLNELAGLNRQNEITTLTWEDTSEKKIYAGLRNQTVKIYDCQLQSFIKTLDCSSGEGPVRGLACYKGHIVTAVESGIITVWNEEDEGQKVEIAAGKNLHQMRQNLSVPHLIATGGEENDLKIWDLQKPEQPIFRAKNVRNDFLDLRIPVWVTDMQFLPNSEKIVTCTRHHHIRLYDPSTPQRRPVITMEFETHPLMSLSLAHREHQIVVGSSRGRMALIDLRKKALVHVFKGFAGSIRYVQCHPTLPLVASCGLDRFFRLHELNTHKLLSKIYLKSRLNSLLLSSDFKWNFIDSEKGAVHHDVSVQQVTTASGDEDDGIWDGMDVVNDKVVSRKRSALDKMAKCKRVKKKRVVSEHSED